ncbi:MAG: hypothetical protein ACTHV8_10545 [Nesterenkonia sp.]
MSEVVSSASDRQRPAHQNLALARRRLDILYAMLRDGTFYQEPDNAHGGTDHCLAA